MEPSSPKRLQSCSSRIKSIWSQLPSELLTSIADDFGIIDLLCFRAVCKDWRAASFSCSAKVESSRMPWLLASPPDYSSTYILYDTTKKAKYNFNIPELKNTICLASDEGWLLLSRGNKIFFFCPFSSAKIEIPEFPHEDLSDHVAAFSCVPTDQECVVAVANCCNEQELELHVIKRGENTWTKYIYNRRINEFNPLTCGTWCEKKTFYFLGDNDVLLTFSPKNTSFKRYTIVSNNEPEAEMMPFTSWKHYLWSCTDKKMLQISETATVSTCGTMMLREHKIPCYIHNEVFKGSSEESHKVIWIHPRFHQLPPCQGWST